ncbi:MAG: acylneuraminate cytidylyltransferase family protein [Steroidobacteraceae bacterium]
MIKLRILALIAARGGSKRVPGKNVRLLGGSPLIVWSIDVAKNIPDICDILVSTDAPDIAEIARRAGASVPWLRPAELSSDLASSAEVCVHALDWYEEACGKVDGLLLLQPTSPFRSRDTVLRGIELFRANQLRTVLGVSPAASHPLWCVQVNGSSIRPFIEGDGMSRRSQDLPPAYALNGAFYLIAPEELRSRGSFRSEAAIPLIIADPAESIDIDTEWDWKLAQALLASNSSNSSNSPIRNDENYLC